MAINKEAPETGFYFDEATSKAYIKCLEKFC